MAQNYQLDPSTVAAVKIFYESQDYAAAYRAILGDLNEQNAAAIATGQAAPIDHDTIAWYTNAPEINDVGGSWNAWRD